MNQKRLVAEGGYSLLQVFTLDESEEWDTIVRSFSNYDTYYLSGYVKAFQIHGDGEPLLLYYESKKDSVRAINVIMKRDVTTAPKLKKAAVQGQIEIDEYYDISTPYGYGGWLMETQSSGTSEKDNYPSSKQVSRSYLFSDYDRWCLENNIVAEFVRFHPILGNQRLLDNEYTIIPLGDTVAIDLTSRSGIWDNMSSKNRNVIRKAKKNNVEIYSGRSPELYEKFRVIYNATMDKDDAEEYYYFEKPFYESICEDLPENAVVMYAVLPGEDENPDEVIAASIFLISNGYMNYHLSGSVRKYSSLAATNLLLYHAALLGHEMGCRTLYLGGGVGSGEDNLFKFKRAFYKGELHRFYIGKKVINNEVYKDLCQLAGVECHSNDIEHSGFFPEYRQ